MRKLLFVFSLLLPALAAYAQPTLERSVLSAAGDDETVSGFSLSWTMGEPVIQTSVSLNGQLILTQGFQQANLFRDGVDPGPQVLLDYEIYPNPASDYLIAKLSSDKPVTLGIVVLDAKGSATPVPSQQVQVVGEKEVRLDLSALAEGFYLLSIQDENGNRVASFTIEKLN